MTILNIPLQGSDYHDFHDSLMYDCMQIKMGHNFFFNGLQFQLHLLCMTHKANPYG